MPDINRELVEHIAHLARLKLSPEEISRFQGELSGILDYFDQIRELDTENVEPLAHPLAVHNVVRSDEPAATYTSDQALQNAPAREGDFFVVPKVLEDQDT